MHVCAHMETVVCTWESGCACVCTYMWRQVCVTCMFRLGNHCGKVLKRMNYVMLVWKEVVHQLLHSDPSAQDP